MTVFIIAELCSNVLVAPDRIETMCEAARRAGADAVKIQLFRADHFPIHERHARQAAHFPRDRVCVFANTARSFGLKAGASVFDKHAIRIAMNAGCDFLKLAAREEHNVELRVACFRAASRDMPIYRSLRWPRGKSIVVRLRGEIPLACIPLYPTPWDNRGISAIPYLSESVGIPFGWSSHTVGWLDVLEAVQAGATIIEKHLALSVSDPEAGWSLLPDDFASMVADIRYAEAMT